MDGQLCMLPYNLIFYTQYLSLSLLQYKMFCLSVHHHAVPVHNVTSLFQCVKALVFHVSSSPQIDINCSNDARDTALHLSAKWGYGESQGQVGIR